VNYHPRVDTTLTGSVLDRDDAALPRRGWGFAVAWCAEQPSRIGEVAFVPPSGSVIVGRGRQRPEDAHARAELIQQRPGVSIKCDPLASKRLSRQQLRLEGARGHATVEVMGRCRTHVNGVLAKGKVRVDTGDTVMMDGALVLVCVQRPQELPPLRDAEQPAFAFGAADPVGIVGESQAVWALRDRVAFIAPTQGHVLLTGESGVGKELVAKALHARSPRARGALVARNAATLPSGLIDAELFGHAASYPNPGTAERTGLIGEADGGTLFLDEIGELAPELQAHLLRVLDADGEYQRLGESRMRRSDFRLVAATNRREEELKSDFLARFKLRIHVPSLGERIEDIPLLLRHLAQRAAATDARVRERYAPEGEPRLAAPLVEALVRHRYTLNVRELDNLLWTAITESAGDSIGLTDGVKSRLSHPATFTDPASLTKGAIEQALESCDGSQQRAYRLLNLKNRDVLYRLLKKHGINPRSR
jgi:two-component system nitrogen regulation response regulator GlnG/two-component system response regulator HydG